MDSSFIPVEVVPSKTPFGLDQLRRSYKTSLSAEAAIAAAPAVGEADETFASMFLMPVSTPESAESATRIDLVYMGVLSEESQTSGPLIVGLSYTIADYHASDDFTNVGGSNVTGITFTATGTTPTTWTNGSVLITPILPEVKHSIERSVATATTYTSSAIFPGVAAVPASLQYYQPASAIVCFSSTSTSAEVCPDPDAVVVADLISWTLAAEQPASSFPDIAAWLLSDAFVQNIVETSNAEEIVPGNYWQITKRKTMNLFPYAPP